MKIVDQVLWQKCLDNNTDPYGSAINEYAERWANLMEERMTGGATVADVAEKASHDADTEGVTGFMHGAAVATLAKVWEHGEALRRWHNSATQIGDEGDRANESGGVLNPAILNIGKS
jgi:hypothetical protein